MSGEEAVARLPKTDFLADYIPAFALVVLFMPLFEMRGWIAGLAELDIASTLILCALSAFILWPLNHRIRETVGMPIIRWLDWGFVKERKEMENEYDFDRLWLLLNKTEKDEILVYQAYGFMYVSLFLLSIAYLATLLTMTALGYGSAPVFHPKFEVAVSVLMVICFISIAVCYFEARTIHRAIFKDYYVQLAEKYCCKKQQP